MNIKEALDSGKRFRRPKWLDWLTTQEVEDFIFSAEDLTAEDYYTETRAVKITAEHFDDAVKKIQLDQIEDFEQYADEIKFYLGLK